MPYPCSAARGRFSGSSADRNLLDQLIVYYPGNEVNGDLLTSHIYGLSLGDVNTVTTNPGLVYATARQYTRANSEYHSKLTSVFPVTAGRADFTIMTTVYLDSKANTQALVSKWQDTNYLREYKITYDQPTDRFVFTIRNMGNTATISVSADALGSPAINTWYTILAWHVSGTSINIQVNGGGINTTAMAVNVYTAYITFAVGAEFSAAPAATNFLDGRIGPTAYWRSLPGEGGALTAAQRIGLFNAGLGLTYASYTRKGAAINTSPIVAFTFDDGYDNLYTNAYPAMQGYPATSFVISDLIGTAGFATSADLQAMNTAGWTIGNHSKTHTNFGTLTQAQIENELNTCRTVLEGLGIYGGRYVSYPYGGYDNDTDRAMVTQGMYTGRKITTGFVTLPFSTPREQNIRGISETTSLPTAKLWIDTLAGMTSAVLILMLHKIVLVGPLGANEWLQSDLIALVDYVEAKGNIRFMNMESVYREQMR